MSVKLAAQAHPWQRCRHHGLAMTSSSRHGRRDGRPGAPCPRGTRPDAPPPFPLPRLAQQGPAAAGRHHAKPGRQRCIAATKEAPAGPGTNQHQHSHSPPPSAGCAWRVWGARHAGVQGLAGGGQGGPARGGRVGIRPRHGKWPSGPRNPQRRRARAREQQRHARRGHCTGEKSACQRAGGVSRRRARGRPPWLEGIGDRAHTRAD